MKRRVRAILLISAAISSFMVPASAQAVDNEKYNYAFPPLGWKGNVKYTYDRTLNKPDQQVKITATIALTVDETGDARGDITYDEHQTISTQVGCTKLLRSIGERGVTTIEGHAQTSAALRVYYRAMGPGGKYTIEFSFPGVHYRKVETTTSANCPTKRYEVDAFFNNAGTVSAIGTLQDQTVPVIAATLPAERPRAGFVESTEVNLTGCGEMSGSQWVNRWRGDNTINGGLESPFREKMAAFKAAVDLAGAETGVASVYRPDQRAFLMHHAFRVARLDPNFVGNDVSKGGGNPAFAPEEPEDVPKYSKGPLPICWVYRDHLTGKVFRESSIQAAELMVSLYGVKPFGAAYKVEGQYPSLHTAHKAVDMNVHWITPSLTVKLGPNTKLGPFTGGYGCQVRGGFAIITSYPKDEENQCLWYVASTYGVYHIYPTGAVAGTSTKPSKGGVPDPPHWSANGH